LNQNIRNETYPLHPFPIPIAIGRPEYLLEILVLIIGIYGAFALDSWNESRKEDAQEIAYLTDLKRDIQYDVETLNQFIKSNQRVL
jgi:hypothetical protein